MLDMIEATQTVDIYNFVCQMRTQRTHMVQVEVSHCFLMSLSKNIIIYSNLFIEVYEKSFQLVRQCVSIVPDRNKDENFMIAQYVCILLLFIHVTIFFLPLNFQSQYVFLHKAVLEAIECGDTEINAPDLRVKMIQLNRTDPDNSDETLMEKQFKVESS